jgi:multidrug efflux pump subunit AcrA (membrane-fusion protein)
LIFLGISTVVFTTAKNWKTATEEQKKKVGELQKKLTDAQAGVDAAKKDLDAAKANYDALTKNKEAEIATLQKATEVDQQQITQARQEVADAQANAKAALAEAEAHRNESQRLRQIRAAVEDQANKYKIKQADLFDRIRELERILETATKNNADLRDRVAKFSTLLRQNNISDDISQVKGTESAPPVVGEVKQTEPTNRKVVITIGSDDGLRVGHELYLFREKPRPEYLGKITIISVDPDQAVGRVNGATYQGKKIKEGDIVSSTIKPRI